MNVAARDATRRRILFGLAIAILAVYALLSVGEARSAALRLTQAQSDLAEVSAKLADIDRLRKTPKVAALQLESPAEITNRVSQARESAGMPQSSLLKEQPSDPVRIDRSDFELRPPRSICRPPLYPKSSRSVTPCTTKTQARWSATSH